MIFGYDLTQRDSSLGTSVLDLYRIRKPRFISHTKT